MSSAPMMWKMNFPSDVSKVDITKDMYDQIIGGGILSRKKKSVKGRETRPRKKKGGMLDVADPIEVMDPADIQADMGRLDLGRADVEQVGAGQVDVDKGGRVRATSRPGSRVASRGGSVSASKVDKNNRIRCMHCKKPTDNVNPVDEVSGKRFRRVAKCKECGGTKSGFIKDPNKKPKSISSKKSKKKQGGNVTFVCNT